MWRRIKAILLQEVFITRRSMEIMIDLPYYSLVTIISFGIFSVFLSGAKGTNSAHYLLSGLIFWEVIRIAQYSVSVSILWNIWSQSSASIFITPLSLKEYIIALMISSFLKALLLFTIISFLTAYIFNFNILVIGWPNLILFFINLIVFSWSLGMIILGLILRFGTRVQSIAWGLILLFQPLMAAYFPVRILPSFIRPISYLLPPTYIFEAARASLSNPSIRWYEITTASFENIILFILSVWLLNLLFRQSLDTGQFTKNEE